MLVAKKVVFAHIDSYRNDCIPNSTFYQIKVNVTNLVDVIMKLWKLANNIYIFVELTNYYWNNSMDDDCSTVNIR